jgi:hypothetical protein
VLVLMIALTAAIAGVAAVAVKVPTTYSSTMSVLLLPPRSGGTYQAPAKGAPTVSPKLINPYLSFDSSLFVLVKVIAQDLMTQRVKDQIQAAGETARYTATPGDLPAINVVVTDPDRTKIKATMKAVVAYANADLAQRQHDAGVPQDTWATATSDNIALIAVAGLGLAAAVSLVFVAESLRRGRGRPIDADRVATVRWSPKEKAAGSAQSVARGSEAWLSAEGRQVSSPAAGRPDDPVFPSRAGEPGS